MHEISAHMCVCRSQEKDGKFDSEREESRRERKRYKGRNEEGERRMKEEGRRRVRERVTRG